MNNPFITPDEYISDNLLEITAILRFLEETAGNFCSHPMPGERAYSVDAWAGMHAILALTREGLEELARNPGLQETKTL